AKTGRLEGQTPSQDQIAGDLAQQWHGTTVYDISSQEWMTYEDGLFVRTDSISIEQRISTYMDQRGHLNSSHAWHEYNHLKFLVIPSKFGKRMRGNHFMSCPLA